GGVGRHRVRKIDVSGHGRDRGPIEEEGPGDRGQGVIDVERVRRSRGQRAPESLAGPDRVRRLAPQPAREGPEERSVGPRGEEQQEYEQGGAGRSPALARLRDERTGEDEERDVG